MNYSGVKLTIMEMTALKTAISYESKLVRRNWLFYFFILGVLGYTIGVLIPWDINRAQWSDVAFASSIPLRGIYFLNLFQSLIVTFIACDIHGKQKKADTTREVLFTRPAGNGQSFLGGLLGILLPFLAVDVIFMLACVFINIFVPDSPVNPLVNLFYLLTRVLPSLVFITGLSLFVNRLVKLPFISWLILTVFLYLAYAYLVTPLHGMLDFRGCWLPDSFSTIVGFMHVEDYLLQRGAFLLLGTSFLCFAVPLARRLPGAPGRQPYFIVAASLLLVFSLCLGYIYVEKFQTRSKNRTAYREAFLEYNKYPTSRVLAHDITYRPGGDRFSATSRMKVQNQRKIKIERLLLFLNPGLEINKIESNGQSVPFHRDRQVVVIERSLSPGENIELEIEYGGSIDEDIYQVNLPDEDYFVSIVYTSFHENYGKRTAFVSDKFTLLVPEVMWYPMAVAPIDMQASREVNFTGYTLRVENPGEMTVLSQGEPAREGNSITFNNVQNLTGLSLCMGKYEKRAITVDSLTVELYTYPGNDFYMKHLDEWKVLKKGIPGREKKLAKIFNKCKDIIEESQPGSYPFTYFKLIETPSSFLRWRQLGDNIQPEIAFFEERFATTDRYRPDDYLGVTSMSRQEYLLYVHLPYNLSLINIDRMFTGHNRSITSDRYTGMDLIFNQMINSRGAVSQFVMPKMLNYIAGKGLKGCITEEYSREQYLAISLKVSHLLGYLTTITTWDSLTRFTQEFNARARFREVNFDSFIEEFEQRFGQNIQAYMDEWYTGHQVPWLSIKDLSFKETKETRVVDFKVGNFSETEGIVSIITFGWSQGGKKVVKNWRSYPVKPGECKRIVVHENIRFGLELTTNFSGNLPKVISFNREVFPSSSTIPDEGVTLLDRDQFYPPGEIIVDNEDKGFYLIDSTDNRKRLADLLTKGDEKEYNSGPKNHKVNTWGVPFFTDDYNVYGDCIRSAFTKGAGTGKFKAEWVANLPEAGKYEIFINRPHCGVGTGDVHKYSTDCPGMKNYYTVYTPRGGDEVILEVEKGDPTWVSLGTFTLPAGESRVVLDDRGVVAIRGEKFGDEYTQLVVADAVKWVKIK